MDGGGVVVVGTPAEVATVVVVEEVVFEEVGADVVELEPAVDAMPGAVVGGAEAAMVDAVASSDVLGARASSAAGASSARAWGQASRARRMAPSSATAHGQPIRRVMAPAPRAPADAGPSTTPESARRTHGAEPCPPVEARAQQRPRYEKTRGIAT